MNVLGVDGADVAMSVGCHLSVSPGNCWGLVGVVAVVCFDPGTVVASASCFVGLFPLVVRFDIVEHLVIIVPMYLILTVVDGHDCELGSGEGVDVTGSSSIVGQVDAFTNGVGLLGLSHC